jgi:AcrR family transcriptional regulator
MTVVSLPPRRKASDRRRAPQIYDAAARVFAQRGFHGATTQDIADLLGIRQASLYYYFASKEAALELVCLKGVEGFFESAKAIAKGPGNCSNRLARMIDSHLSPLADRADYIRVFLNERHHLPKERRLKIGKWSQGLEKLFEDVLKEGIRKGEFRSNIDTRIAVLGILGMVNWAPVWFGREGATLSHISGEFSRMILQGIATESSRKSP